MKGCGPNTLKTLVFIFNFLAFLGGLGILITSIVFYSSPQFSPVNLTHMSDLEVMKSWQKMLVGGMAIGGIIVGLSVLGCCAAMAESGTLLCLYVTVMSAIMIAQLSMACFVYAVKDKFKLQLHNFLESQAIKADKGNGSACSFYTSLAHRNICCGFNSTEPQMSRVDVAALVAKYANPKHKRVVEPLRTTHDPAKDAAAALADKGLSPLPPNVNVAELTKKIQDGSIQLDTLIPPDVLNSGKFGEAKCLSFTCDKSLLEVNCDEKLWRMFVKGAQMIGFFSFAFLGLELFSVIFGCCLWGAIRRGENRYDQFE